MNRRQFQDISRLRVIEAKVLLDNNQYAGAYYLIGYAVECALKACAVKQVRRFDLPDKKFVNDVYTHNLESLMRLSGLAQDFDLDRKANSTLDINWITVKDWSESVRYELGITEVQASELYSACTGKDGILPWIRKKW